MTASPQSLPGLFTDPARPVTFTFEGQTIQAVAGQSIAAALYAAGRRIFTRSFKYHRPRGLFCVSGDCPNCLMQVDGKPNVRTCIEPVRDGQVVCHQNAWPSLDWDMLRIFDWFDRFLPVGFYYKRFHKPRWLWPIFEHIVRNIAGLGRVDIHAKPNLEAEIEHIHTDVCVVGGGPAGMSAAIAAAEAGANVLLLERYHRLGGHLLYNPPHASAADALDQLIRNVQGQRLVRILSDTLAFGLYEENLLGAFQPNRFLKVRAKQIIICTGGRQQPYVFHNNDLPGVFLGDAVLRLARWYGVPGGKRAVVLTDRDEGQHLAEQLHKLGIEVAAVIDLRAGAGTPPSKRWSTLSGHTVVRAKGRTHLKAVRVARLDERGEVTANSDQDIGCDLLCMASGLVPANELLHQGGMRFEHKGGSWMPKNSVPGLVAAGAAAGTFQLEAQIEQGRRHGFQAAAALGQSSPPSESAVGVLSRSAQAGVLLPQARPRDRKRFICLCEDVTEKDLVQTVAEGFADVETMKRYSTVNMGPCQGKVCGLTAAAVCARETGRGLAMVGVTTSRPPVQPVELGVLAAGRHHPVRRTPLHHWHDKAGAKWLDAGLWKRPESYGDPLAEVRSVRENVGLIDVSTLGKIEVIGPDATELLERIYLNRWSDLKLGRARYGAMCNEDGILFDDGVGARLAEDRFYLTATTGNAEAVVQWIELWKTTWRLDALILNQTSALAAMNLAGPRSREVLSRLTSLDVTNASFPYMTFRQADVAGVPCRLLRIGFVGELGYEIHCASGHAWHLWEALHASGQEFGLKPFGVEAQRILRLEKGHLIIGQDTDALSNPLEAGLEWMVRFDKSMFIGREPLLRLKARPARGRLVGFHMLDNHRAPEEGCQVVESAQTVGRITSVRYSPTLEKHLGLAWIPATRANTGERFQVRSNGKDVACVVTELPFYDKGGSRLKG